MSSFFKGNPNYPYQKGFTLIEIAIALMIIGIISVPLMQMYNIYRIDRTNFETTGDMSAVKTALIKFVYRNGRYPIPADRSVIYASAGDEYAGPITACSPANTTVCSAIAGWATAPNNVVLIGGVPFAALGLPKQYATDGYKNKLTYAVTQSLTTGTFNDSGGIIRVVDINGAQRTPAFPDAMHFVIISHGKDGKGAFSLSGLRSVSCTSAQGQDVENCNDDAVFTDNFNPNLKPRADRQQADLPGTNHYDDFAVFLYTLGSGIWQKVPPAPGIFSNAGHLKIGPGVGYPEAQIDITGDSTTPGDLKADTVIINRLCGYAEAVGCNAAGAGTGLSAHGSVYLPNEFQPGIIADAPDPADVQRPGGGIACGTPAMPASPAMIGIANADEKCMNFPSTFNVTGCPAGTVSTGTDASGNFVCVTP